MRNIELSLAGLLSQKPSAVFRNYGDFPTTSTTPPTPHLSKHHYHLGLPHRTFPTISYPQEKSIIHPFLTCLRFLSRRLDTQFRHCLSAGFSSSLNHFHSCYKHLSWTASVKVTSSSSLKLSATEQTNALTILSIFC